MSSVYVTYSTAPTQTCAPNPGGGGGPGGMVCCFDRYGWMYVPEYECRGDIDPTGRKCEGGGYGGYGGYGPGPIK